MRAALCPSGLPVYPGGVGGGGGGIVFGSGTATSVRSLNLCDPKDAAKLAKALGDLALGAIGFVPILGDAVTAIQIGSQIANGMHGEAATGYSKALAGHLVPGLGNLINLYDTAENVGKDLSDPPQNVTPQLGAAFAQLSTEADRLLSVASAYTELFGSADWVSLAIGDTAGGDEESAWLKAFLQDAAAGGGSGQPISSAQQTASAGDAAARADYRGRRRELHCPLEQHTRLQCPGDCQPGRRAAGAEHQLHRRRRVRSLSPGGTERARPPCRARDIPASTTR